MFENVSDCRINFKFKSRHAQKENKRKVEKCDVAVGKVKILMFLNFYDLFMQKQIKLTEFTLPRNDLNDGLLLS